MPLATYKQYRLGYKEEYKAQLRRFDYPVWRRYYRKHKADIQYLWGDKMGKLMYLIALVGLQWARFLSFCVKGGK